MARAIATSLIGCVMLTSCGNGAGDPASIPPAVDKSIGALLPPDAITLTSAGQITPRRQALRNLIWGSTSLPNTQAVPRAPTGNCQLSGLIGVAKTEELRIAMDLNQEGLACHYVAATPNAKLVVFNPGHACSVADGSTWNADAGSFGDQRAIQTLLSDGYSVLATFMPHYRPDDCPAAAGAPDPHGIMFATLHPTSGSVWKYFVEPINASLNYLAANGVARGFPVYTEFDMVGLSGGGWTTTVYAAVDTRIRTSVQVAGSEPLEMWNNNSDGAEQTTPALYNVAAYRDLYTLGAAGAGRRQIQVLNPRDNCCFFPGWQGFPATSWESTLRSMETNIRSNLFAIGELGIFRLEIDEASVEHQISRDALGNVILSELEGGRLHVGAASSTDAFVRGSNDHIWHFGASVWEDTGLSAVGVPAVLAGGTHGIDLFYRDQGNAIRQGFKVGSAWTSVPLNGVIVSDPAVVSWGPGRFDVVAFGGDYKLYHWSSAGGGFDLPVAALQGVGTPTLVSAGVNSLDAFFRDTGGGVSRLFWNGSNWGSEPLGGSIMGVPGAAVTSGPVRRVYALGHDNLLYENAKAGSGAWSGWASVSMAAGATSTKLAGSPLALVRSSDGVVTVQVRTTANQLAVFARPAGWNLTLPGGPTLLGAPTPVAAGITWAHGVVANDLQRLSGGVWSAKGGFFE